MIWSALSLTQCKCSLNISFNLSVKIGNWIKFKRLNENTKCLHREHSNTVYSSQNENRRIEKKWKWKAKNSIIIPFKIKLEPSWEMKTEKLQMAF